MRARKKLTTLAMLAALTCSAQIAGAQECESNAPMNWAEAMFQPKLEVEKASSTEAKVAIKVFSIQNGDALQLSQIVRELFGLEQKSETESKMLSGLRVSVDQRTNSIIASGTQGELQVVQDLLERLDIEKQRPSETTVYQLQNAAVVDVAQSAAQWLALKHKDSSDYVITPELVSNSLIVTSSLEEADARDLDDVIRALDERPDMIKVEMVIKQVVDGEETVLSKPTVMTIDGLSGSIQVGSVTDSIKVELTPKIINEPVTATKVTRLPSASNNR